jgi:sugar phosphate isomerase/epimerase
MAQTARLLLKARPTSSQLTDRLRPVDGVWPDGLELYLAAADLADVGTVISRVNASEVPEGFAWLIEGPVDSLDGGDFDVTRDSEADLEVLRRIAQIASGIGARAVNIHVIAPSPDVSRLTLDYRARLLERAVPFLAEFVELMHNAGAVPTVEHMPPVLRMRRSDLFYSPIGMASEDFRFLTQRLDGLRVLIDTSHAGLYLNARRDPPDALREYLPQLPSEQKDLTDFLASFPNVENAQISNAQGILGEGLAYAAGDFDLDPVVKWLGAHVQHIVTETLEANNEDAVLMRDALRHMRRVLN